MDIPEESCCWMLDYSMIERSSDDLPPLQPCVNWTSSAFDASTDQSLQFVDSFGKSDVNKEHGSNKRLHDGSCHSPDSKACREKRRRDRLNDRFQDLTAILEPGRTPKTDKSVILSDAVRLMTRLRGESNELRESCEDLQKKINELQAEKNELRDEKQKLKAEKDRLEQQLKALSNPPPPFFPPAFSAPAQVMGSKLVPLIGYPGVPMWHFTPPASVDTSEDHVLRPPVA